MVITSTAIGFGILSLGLAVCGFRFLIAFKKTSGLLTDRKIGFLLGTLFLMTSIHNGVLGLGALLFTTNPQGLYLTLIIAQLFLTGFALMGVYTIHYIFWPQISPYFSMALVIILGFVGEISILINHPQPFITDQNSIDWNMGWTLSLISFYLFAIGLITLLYVFIQLFLKTQTSGIKVFSLIIAISAAIGLVNVFIRLILLYNAPANVRSPILDSFVGFIGSIFIIALVIVPLLKNHVLKRKNETTNSHLK